MNFFGHALIARRHGLDDDAVLGAMLPDFVGMLGLRLLGAHANLGVGVELHHDTDRRFHAHPAFVELCARGVDTLTARGVERGPARASSHVGLELLLDGILSTEALDRAAYRRALQRALEPAAAAALTFRDVDGHARLEALATRLLSAPLPEAYAEPSRVAERLAYLLSYRPRLALAPGNAQLVHDWLSEVRPALLAQTPALLHDLTREPG